MTHDDNCQCDACKHEKTSMEEAGGVSVGFTGHVHGVNADAIARFSKALLNTGKWTDHESGCFLGHIKMAIVAEGTEGVTLSLTDLEHGVNRIGTMDPCEKADFNFMAAVCDVDKHELAHVMIHEMGGTGLDLHYNDNHHDHDHGSECTCGHDHGHEHHHEHEEECSCGCGHHHDHGDHHHEHGEECGCGHDHGHEHHHEHGEGCCCGHKEEKPKAAKACPIKSFFARFKKK